MITALWLVGALWFLVWTPVLVLGLVVGLGL